MRIDVVTLFPAMVEQAATFGVTGRAIERKLWELATWNPRDFAGDSYRTVDDRPYGGGPGMVMLAEPLTRTIGAARKAQADAGVAASRTIYLSPAGTPLTHQRVVELAGAKDAGYVLVAGRYEGVDERLLAREVDEEIAIGEFVVSGGELPALMLIDAMVRQLPGALNDAASAEEESFVNGLLDCPHYTRPETFAGEAVPEVLLSGHHALIRRWRLKASLARTMSRRPDLFERHALSKEEAALVAEIRRQASGIGIQGSGGSKQNGVMSDPAVPTSEPERKETT